ncbi:MAG: nucleoside-diphosphate-sugar epimerase [Granulosicoccus sp.]|jgi:nucleoside-diphosphate-sugar epimerase
MEVNKKILVTGGTGFLGSYLLRYLVQKGYNNIFAIRRATSKMDLVRPIEDKIQWVECDILDVKGLEKVMVGVEQVYHSAAMVSFEAKHRKRMHQVNIQGTANVVNLALENNIEKLVHVSSIAALGRRKRLKEITEKTKWEKSKFNSEYAVSKYLSEQEVWRGMAEGLRACIINPAIILGAGFWDEGSASFFSKMNKGNKFYGLGSTGFVDVRDVSRLMIEMMESEMVGEKVIANGENVSYRKVFEMIADSINKKRPSIALNPILGAFAWRAEWLRSKITGSSALVTKETVENSFRTWIYQNQKSIDTFNFKYTPIEQTIQETGELFLEATQKEKRSMYLGTVKQ